ncbi:MAG: DegQ family serine endoprotease [Gammaproteobacteria bacterium]|nr:DegQ family serine endoprotease [Gammaproteobacteria bacterium]
MKSLTSISRAALYGIVLALPFTALQARELPDFTVLVEKNSAAVVNISTTQKIQHPRGRMPRGGMQPPIPQSPDSPPLDDLFRHFFGDGGEGPENFNTQSLGSGFIISAQGYVLTNNHVVKNADKIVVRLSDRRDFTAEVVGTDERSDIALLKIKADNLPVIKIGNSSNVKVGEWVLAIGSPFGFDHSATAGIVSAVGRNLPSESYVPFIQTDVAINPGNSGGPLFNLDGEVIGINSQIFSRTGGFMGLSFAIPMDVAMEVTEQLKNKGQVSRGWLGIIIQDVTQELAESFGMSKPQGALVAKVLPGGPAEKAGIQTGDIVLEFDGKEVEESSNLPRLVGRSKVGEPSSVKVLRNGKPLMLKVKVAELPKQDQIRTAGGEPKTSADNKLGVVVRDLDPEQRKQLEIKSGVIVQQVDDGPAFKGGLRRGDVILRINNDDVADTQAFNRIVKALPAKPVRVLVQRGRGTLWLALKMEK